MTDRRYPAQVGAVATGLLVTSALTYAFQVIAARTLSATDFGLFGAMWSLFFLVLIVVYLGLEQRIAAAVASGSVELGSPSNLGRLGIVAGLGATAVPLTGLAFGPELSLGTWIVLGLGAAGYAGVYTLRGLASGTSRFWRYGSLFATEAGSRLVVIGVVLAAAAGVAVSTFASAMAVAPWVALTLLGWDLRKMGWRSEAPPIQLRAVGAIGVANLSLAGILNLGPVIVVGRQTAEAAGVLFAALVIVRVPLYLLQSVTTTLLPYLAGLTASQGVIRARKRVLAIAYGIGAVGAIAVFAGVPVLEWAARIFFGPDLVLPRVEFAVLGIGISWIIASLIINQFFVVVHRENQLAGAWTIGFVVFLVVALLAGDARAGASVGLLAGAVVTIGMLTIVAQRFPPPPAADQRTADTDEAADGQQ